MFKNGRPRGKFGFRIKLNKLYKIALNTGKTQSKYKIGCPKSFVAEKVCGRKGFEVSVQWSKGGGVFSVWSCVEGVNWPETGIQWASRTGSRAFCRLQWRLLWLLLQGEPPKLPQKQCLFLAGSDRKQHFHHKRTKTKLFSFWNFHRFDVLIKYHQSVRVFQHLYPEGAFLPSNMEQKFKIWETKKRNGKTLWQSTVLRNTQGMYKGFVLHIKAQEQVNTLQKMYFAISAEWPKKNPRCESLFCALFSAQSPIQSTWGGLGHQRKRRDHTQAARTVRYIAIFVCMSVCLSRNHIAKFSHFRDFLRFGPPK